MHVWNVLHAVRWIARRKKYAKISLCAPSTTLSDYTFARKARIHNQKKKLLTSNIYIFHTSSQYGELRPTNGWHPWVSFWAPSKFQRVSRLGFVTAPTSLNRGQPYIARCLAVSGAGVYTLCLKKNVPPLQLAIIFTYTVRLRQFLAQMLPTKQAIKMYFKMYPLFSHHT